MKIYTKTGDKGSTSLLGGARVIKNDVQIEAYGTVDELNANIGLLRDKIKARKESEVLLKIQNDLFLMGSYLAVDENFSLDKLPKFSLENYQYLENKIDEYNLELTAMTHFILPGGHELVSLTHIVRTVCRRAERRIVDFKSTKNPNKVVDDILIYLNRLSDFLFVLARKVAKDYGVKEIAWNIEH